MTQEIIGAAGAAPMLNRTPRGASECHFKPHAGRGCACVMVYNPLHNRWRAVTPMLHARLSFGAVADGRRRARDPLWVLRSRRRPLVLH